MGHDRTGRVRTDQSQARVPGLYLMQSIADTSATSAPSHLLTGAQVPPGLGIRISRALTSLALSRIASAPELSRCSLHSTAPSPSTPPRPRAEAHPCLTSTGRYSTATLAAHHSLGTSAALHCAASLALSARRCTHLQRSLAASLGPPPHSPHLIHPSFFRLVLFRSSPLLLSLSLSPAQTPIPILAPAAAGSWLPALSISSLSQLGFRLQSVPSPP